MTEAALLARLRATPPFTAVDEAVLARLPSGPAVQAVAKGAALLAEGERPGSVPLLL